MFIVFIYTRHLPLTGKSAIVAQRMAASLASTGTPAHFIHATEWAHGDLGRRIFMNIQENIIHIHILPKSILWTEWSLKPFLGHYDSECRNFSFLEVEQSVLKGESKSNSG